MKQLEAIIIEDDKDHLTLLKMYLNEFCSEIKVTATASTIADTTKLLQENTADIIFLDVDIQGEKSFNILEKITFERDVEIIVISSHEKYALEAFKHLVTDYVLKPLRPEGLLVAIKKVKQNISLRELASKEQEEVADKEPLKRLAIPSVETVEIIAVDEVMYLESDGRYTTFHLKDNTSQTASKNLGEYEKLLANNQFLRIHHSILVNMNFALNIHKKDGFYLRMTSQKYLPISKRKINSLYRYLNLK